MKLVVIAILSTLGSWSYYSVPSLDFGDNHTSVTIDTFKVKSALELLAAKIDSTSISKHPQPSIMHAPKVYDFDKLGMFCKFDALLDKGSKMQLRFRLGTLETVDRKEGNGPTATPIIDP